MLVIKFMRFVGQCMHCVGGVRNRISVFTACHTSGETELLGTDRWKSDGRGGTFLSCLNFFSCGLVVQDFFLWFINLLSYVARGCSNIFPLDFRLPEFFFCFWSTLPITFLMVRPLQGFDYFH